VNITEANAAARVLRALCGEKLDLEALRADAELLAQRINKALHAGPTPEWVRAHWPAPQATKSEPKWSEEHTPIKHESCEQTHCMFCDDGLFGCSVCGSFEGATTTHCPGRQMYAEYGDRVYRGEVDFRDGEWREGECSRHTPAYWRTPAGLAEIEKARAEG
jgi:hypothetical protein